MNARQNDERKARRAIALIVGTALVFASCRVSAPTTRTELVFGTVCAITLPKPDDALLARVFARLRELEATVSANRDDTNVAEINRSSGISPAHAAPDTIAILRAALSYAKQTDGLFDPTIGPLVKAWGIGTDAAAVPSQDTIDAARSLVDYRRVTIGESDTVFLSKSGMRLDLGGIAKGHAADLAAQILREAGADRAIVDLGGNIYAVGEKKRGTPWTIGIRDPETNRGAPILSIPVSNASVVTSGAYERFFVEGGRRYHHIVNPRTGWPAETGLLSVTIVSPNSMRADALSTSAFLLGAKEGLALVEAEPEAEAIIIDAKRRIYATSGLRGKIRVLDDRFSVADGEPENGGL